MDAFDYIWHGRFDKGFTKGKTEGIAIGKAEGIVIGETKARQRNIRNLASYLVKESGDTLTQEEATEKAKSILEK